jgi:hypothetical protein
MDAKVLLTKNPSNTTENFLQSNYKVKGVLGV